MIRFTRIAACVQPSRPQRAGLLGCSLALSLIMATAAPAQDDRMMPIPVPAQPDAIALGTGGLPGATASESWHRQYGSVFARNVTRQGRY